MSEVNPTMTGLEMCFEEELTSIPGWHSDFLELEHSHSDPEPDETQQDKTVAALMLLDA
jgi:hypothetical protein